MSQGELLFWTSSPSRSTNWQFSSYTMEHTFFAERLRVMCEYGMQNLVIFSKIFTTQVRFKIACHHKMLRFDLLEDIIQAVHVSSTRCEGRSAHVSQGSMKGEYSYIATATAAKEKDTYIKIWRAKRSNNSVLSLKHPAQS